MYEGFERFEIQTSDPEVKIVGHVGGKGPAVLLLHGNPLTHVHWHLVAPRLARDFTVVATDLRGYGDSGKPRGKPDSSNYSFRRMGQDQFDVMSHLGFEQDRMIHAKQPGMGRALDQKRAVTAEMLAQGHHDRFAQGIDRRIGDLCEPLAEVGVHSLREPREWRDRRVVSHTPDRIVALRHGFEDESQILVAIPEADLMRNQ